LNIKICVSVDKKASASGRLRPQTRYQGIALNPTGDPALRYIQCESKNPPPCGFLKIFPNGWEFLINFYTPIMRSFLHYTANFYSNISNKKH